MKEFFNLKEANLAQFITEVKLPRFQDSGKCRGYAHVAFSSQDSYDKALKLSGQRLGPRYLDVKPAAGKQTGGPAPQSQEDTLKVADSMPDTCKTLFVKNLPYSLGEDDIGDRFRPFGEIHEVRIARNWKTQESKGFAYVVFKEHPSAKAALLKMNGKELANFEGRHLKVDFDVRQEAKGSFKVNTADAGNVRYNKQIKKEVKGNWARKSQHKGKFEKTR